MRQKMKSNRSKIRDSVRSYADSVNEFDTPKLFMEDYEGESGKLERSLREYLNRYKMVSSCLIFSQFRGMLDIIE